MTKRDEDYEDEDYENDEYVEDEPSRGSSSSFKNNKILNLAGAFNEDDMEMADEEEQDEEERAREQSKFEAKERELREQIAARFKLVEFQNDIDVLEKIVRTSEYKNDAFKYRIIMNDTEHVQFNEALNDINKHLAMCQSILDAYVTFQNSTPKFSNLLNTLYHFHAFLTEQRARPYYEVKLQRENKHYYVADQMRKYVSSVTFLLQRMMGTLEVAGWYVIDSELEAARASHASQGGGFGDYNPYNDSFNRHSGGIPGKIPNMQYTKMILPQRDIGDAGDV